MIKAIIYDMDGVIVDSEPLWRRAKINAVARFGGTINEQLAFQTTGLRINEIAQHWINYCDLDPACSKELENAIIDEVVEQIKTQGKLLPGVKTSLEYLCTTDLEIGLASSSPLRLIETVLETFGLKQYFSIYESAEHLAHGKPHPQVYLNTAQRLNISPLQCLAIEDSVTGLIAAKAARMKTICVPESTQRDDPRFSIADIKLLSLQEFYSKRVVELLGQGG